MTESNNVARQIEVGKILRLLFNYNPLDDAVSQQNEPLRAHLVINWRLD